MVITLFVISILSVAAVETIKKSTSTKTVSDAAKKSVVKKAYFNKNAPRTYTLCDDSDIRINNPQKEFGGVTVKYNKNGKSFTFVSPDHKSTKKNALYEKTCVKNFKVGQTTNPIKWNMYTTKDCPKGFKVTSKTFSGKTFNKVGACN